jgi:hypothetical protein
MNRKSMTEDEEITAKIKDLSEKSDNEILVKIRVSSNAIWIQPLGYGEKVSAKGQGWPICLEIWDGKLRLLVWDDINTEDPTVIELEGAKESLS